MRKMFSTFSMICLFLLLAEFPLVARGFSVSPGGILTNAVQTSIDNVKEKPPNLLFPGGGLFFYWQAGVVSYLRESGYNMDDVRLAGASAGALTATLTATGVDFYRATELALDLSKEAGVWDRSGGLQGVWGAMIETWLEELLPEDALQRVENRLSLLVTELPSFQKNRVEAYSSRRDLIDCNMASVHLPWFLDGRLAAEFRGAPHIDGSFLAAPRDFGLTNEHAVIIPNFKNDPYMNRSILDFVRTVSPDSIYDLLERGKLFAKVMEEQGDFASLSKK